MLVNQDYYQTLSLKREATDNDVRVAYRKMALKHHPERNTAAGSKEKFNAIAEAYHVLSDGRRKAIFDQYGVKGLMSGVPSREHFSGFPGGYEFHGDGEAVFNEFFGTKNPFADFFVGQVDSTTVKRQFGKKFGGLHGMATSAQSFEPTQDTPINFELDLTLEELYVGTVKKIKISRKVLNNDGMTTASAEKILTIPVQAGWKTGTKIVFAKEGDQGPNKIPTDVIFNVTPLKHDRFTRDGDNLKYQAEVPLVKALVGYSLEIESLDGRLLRIPVNDTITPTYIKVVKGEGMPNSKNGARGDLLISFKTSFPQGLTTHQKNLLMEAFKGE